jgi:seryl-tRNA synthetase
LNAIEKLYPVLLPMEGYEKTGYIKKSPQYAIFCGTINETIEDLEKTSFAIYKKQVNKIINEPEYALSPSACFHTYIEYQDKELSENMVVSFRQNVFRNEGKFNYSEIGRLRDYQVREIVLIGNNRFVIEMRDKIMEATADLMNTLGLKGDISLANDSFVVPKMQMHKKIQRIDKSKYEMHLYVSDKKKISTASFNLHGKAFTSNFNISVKGVEDTVTGCVGFGLHRWIIAFVAQYGWNEEMWPEIVKEAYVLYRKEHL